MLWRKNAELQNQLASREQEVQKSYARLERLKAEYDLKQKELRVTRLVQALLSPEERQRFDRGFLGVMGIDVGLGNNDGARHRFVTAGGAVVPLAKPLKNRVDHCL